MPSALETQLHAMRMHQVSQALEHVLASLMLYHYSCELVHSIWSTLRKVLSLNLKRCYEYSDALYRNLQTFQTSSSAFFFKRMLPKHPQKAAFSQAKSEHTSSWRMRLPAQGTWHQSACTVSGNHTGAQNMFPWALDSRQGKTTFTTRLTLKQFGRP